jgi:LAO/AO transport system kinase
VRSGDPRALARAISIVENHSPGWIELLKELFPHTGKARTIGLTGAPGAGKSTLVDQLAKQYRNTRNTHSDYKVPELSGPPEKNAHPTTPPLQQAQGRPLSGAPNDDYYTVGIIAVDPTSPYTGGAILGDRIRMQQHFSDPGIYIRSMATRGSLGGLARTTADVALVLDAAGRDLILIETVGVGQDEIDIVRLADVTVVILVPGMGDDVQTIKAGIMEIADIFVINKVDHEGADRVEREIRAMQSLAMRGDEWTPPIVKAVATEGRGVKELADAIAAYESHQQKHGLVAERRTRNWESRLLEMLRDTFLQQARAVLPDEELSRLAAEVAEHKRDPYSVIEEVAGRIRNRE